MNIIDRRKNPKGKSLSNRQRFIERVKKQVKSSVNKKMGERSITDDSDSDVTVSRKSIDEPRFRHSSDDGNFDQVLPGNEEYMPGDTIDKPPGGGGRRGHEGSDSGDGEDEFTFTLTRDEYLNIIFDGLELPNLTKRSEKALVQMKMQRAGHTPVGMPANLNIERTAMAGLSRRIALRTPKLKRIHELEAELVDTEDETRRAEIEEEIRRLRIRARSVAFLDNVDLRYNNFVQKPQPITRAVMFAVMDVSASMEEREKTIAKKFFILLYLFLQRKYKHIDVVFVRHHSEASEVDEETFFYDKETGGTVVSTAYEKVLEIIKDRYPADTWNLYLAQATDGDNTYSDNALVADLVANHLLPKLQYMTYVEIMRSPGFMYYEANRDLWLTMDALAERDDTLTCTRIGDESEVVTAFRALFTPKT